MPTTLTPETTPMGDIVAREEYGFSDREEGHYCVHGTYVGSWAGPDYLCGPCEDSAYVHHTGAQEYHLTVTIEWDGHVIAEDAPTGTRWVSYTPVEEAQRRIDQYLAKTDPSDDPRAAFSWRVIGKPYSFWDTPDAR